jgi:hypothetical protein
MNEETNKPCSGIGYKWNEETNEVWIIMEVADLAEDALGELSPAGAIVKMGNFPKCPPCETVKALADAVKLEGIAQCGIEADDITLITYDEFNEKGYT